MTMDIRQSRLNVKINGHCVNPCENGMSGIEMAQAKVDNYRTGKSSTKRSFDVAFLMMPDEKLKSKQVKKVHSPTIDVESDSTQSTRSEDLSVKNGFSPIRPAEERNFNLELLSRPRPQGGSPQLMQELNSERLSYMFPHARFYENPSLMAIREKASGNFLNSELPRSAFSKVTSITVPDSPIPPLSPDQQSCPSSSPPISISPGAPTNFRYDYPFINGSPQNPADLSPQQASKSKPMMYRPPIQDPELPQGYFSSPSFMPFAAGAPQNLLPEVDGIMRNPAAAAILSTLLPTTMGAFSLSAQNTCAKCNISFRMTSDLVYHMRSHHKNEHQQDPHRRKREEKLKCPVCNESFRERHHLTRHMTAHQDKAGDLLDPKKRTTDQRQGGRP
ncbi:Krueppel-like factor 11 [Toxorhynchites rutilus septentrionalis]|uniref:Krueppel-like factor 11 n=1 Tax=Toxorhynchites rutilus septentrionalis TaxID=329112 RepID=UPI00247B0CA8|nr:Krueppel-like factor 11 [Toxorhynchites rutilus septentrionalis]